jgi:pimeloyl-ACP methyl ester carboxylesterase
MRTEILRSILLGCAGAGGAALAAYGGWLFLRQSAIVFKPSRKFVGNPADRGIPYCDVFLPLTQHVLVHGWWLPQEAPSKVVLYFPGSIGNISHELGTSSFLFSLGVSVLIIDYPGFGKSSGRPSEAACYAAAEAAWTYLVDEKQFEPQNVVVFGRSLGVAVAAWTAAEHRCGGLVCHGGLTSVPDVASQSYRLLPSRYFCYFRFNTRKYIRECRCPVLVLHSEADAVIPVSHGHAIFEAAPRPKQFMSLVGNHSGDEWQATGGVRPLLKVLFNGEAATWD